MATQETTDEFMISIAKNGTVTSRVAGFFESGGAFARACASTPFPFEIRPQQQAMASAVAEALDNAEHLAVEAGTGVGKTFAYLVPLILSAVENERRLAVSTHTINLQEQLMFKDIPFLRENMGMDFKAVLCKGRHNYVCLRRLASANLMSGDLFNKGHEKELARIRRWADESQNDAGASARHGAGGSLSDFSDESAQPSPEVWRQVCSEHDNCLGRKCMYYARCFLMKARAAADDAQILVLNHHLLFSDLALRRAGGAILPECAAVVIDEAHNLEEVAGEHLGLRLSQGGLYHWLRRLYTPATGKGLLAALREYEMADEVSRLWDGADHFFMEVAEWAALDGKNGAKRIIGKERSFKTMLTEQIAAAMRRLEGVREAVEDEAVKSELNAIVRRGGEIRQTLDFFLKAHEKNYVYWVEREGYSGTRPGARGRLALVSAPVDVAPLLKDMVFNSFAPVVLTSATLAAGGSLEFFKNRVGAENCRDLVLGSPFNYQRQMKVFIAEDMPGPNDKEFPEAATKAVAHFVGKTRGRAFVLFTNAELMRKVAGNLEDFFAREELLALVQGEGLPRHAMLKKFKNAHQEEMKNEECRMQNEREDKNQSKIQNLPAMATRPQHFAQRPACNAVHSTAGRCGQAPQALQAGQKPAHRSHEPCEGEGGSKIGKAVLFGLDSFWMGVDVPGEALSNVIIVRLPFAVPDEPLVKARIDLLTAEGKDAFREYSLPQAILKFRQGVGRLIRTASDEGIIVILDSRIISRWYGKYFLQAIPACPLFKVKPNGHAAPLEDGRRYLE